MIHTKVKFFLWALLAFGMVIYSKFIIIDAVHETQNLKQALLNQENKLISLYEECSTLNNRIHNLERMKEVIEAKSKESIYDTLSDIILPELSDWNQKKFYYEFHNKSINSDFINFQFEIELTYNV